MNQKTLVILLAICIFSCKNENLKKKHNDILTIKLERKGLKTSIGKSNSSFKFLDSIESKEFKGVFNKDSSFVTYYNIVNSKELKDLLEKKKISKELYDSVKTRIYCLSGFKNGKQYFCLDENGNKNFSDDKIKEFDKNISREIDENWKLLDSFSVLKIGVNKIENETLYKDTLFIKIFPDLYGATYPNETKSEKFKHSLQLTGKTSNYLLGSFSLGDTEYKVGAVMSYFFFSKSDSAFSYGRNDMYSILDTIKIENSYFKIENLSQKEPDLTLRRLDISEKKHGFRIGDYTKNYEVEDLDGKKSSFKEVLGNKKLLLIDFWGTWCGPCKELTPEIVALHNEFKENVSFMSLAYEKDSEPVKKYVAKNNMNWFNGLIQGVPKSSDMSNEIISGLRVECFPTFIVLDNDLNILFYGCGGDENFSNLKDSLTNYFKE